MKFVVSEAHHKLASKLVCKFAGKLLLAFLVSALQVQLDSEKSVNLSRFSSIELDRLFTEQTRRVCLLSLSFDLINFLNSENRPLGVCEIVLTTGGY